jgi:hypothetical protein
VPATSPEERSLHAAAAAHQSWSQTTDRAKRTAPARAAALAKLHDEVDPERVLSPQERDRRAESARRARLSAIAAKAAKDRRTAAGDATVEAIVEAVARVVATAPALTPEQRTRLAGLLDPFTGGAA